MALQPVIQGTELPGQFGEWLTVITPPATLPRQFTLEDISAVEVYLCPVESAAENLGIIVEYARRAGQDDDAARRFDEWTENHGPVGAFDRAAKLGFPRLNRHSERICKIMEGWQRNANAGLIEPHPPPELVERAVQLDTRIKQLTMQFTKRHDNDLIARLLMRIGKQRHLTLEEQFRLADAVSLDWKVKEEPSLRRADWYGADGG